MNGLLLLKKPVGITSFDCIRKLRKITGVKKIGHAGTLDPAASGLMLILFGDTCKQSTKFTKLDKIYTAEITLGQTSTSDDSEGEITNVSDKIPTQKQILDTLKQFEGAITQTPPTFSAIKVQGQRAYRLARAGKTVHLSPRSVKIYALKLKNYNYPKLEITTQVSSGTYIRSLARDLGSKLRTGAYLSKLNRTNIGNFTLDQAFELAELDYNQVVGVLQSA